MYPILLNPANSNSETDNEEEEETPTTYKITLTVDDGTDPVQGAKVTFTDKTDNTKTFESSSSGSLGGCSINSIPAGTYVVTATCTGYEAYTHSSDVVVSADASLTISLTEE